MALKRNKKNSNNTKIVSMPLFHKIYSKNDILCKKVLKFDSTPKSGVKPNNFTFESLNYRILAYDRKKNSTLKKINLSN